MPPIVHVSARRLDLRHYGIQVPLWASRPEQVYDYLQQVFGAGEGAGWLQEITQNSLTREDLLRVHTPSYVQTLLSTHPHPAIEAAYELYDAQGRPHRYDPDSAILPLSDIVARSMLEASGTWHTAEVALEEGFGYFLGGGMHHAMAHAGRGFCLIHDVVIAARKLQAEQRVSHSWVIDTDCHKGDGTAHLAIGDPHLSTLSIHMAHGWPLDEPPTDESGHLKPPFFPSTVDIPIPAGGEASYLPWLEHGLWQLAQLSPRADVAFVVAGSDPFMGDVLPSASHIKLSLDQMLRRDLLVYSFLEQRGIPQVWVMAGGYGPEVWRVHAQTAENLLRRRGWQGI